MLYLRFRSEFLDGAALGDPAKDAAPLDLFADEVRVCVCVCERERERVRVRVCERERECVLECV